MSAGSAGAGSQRARHQQPSRDQAGRESLEARYFRPGPLDREFGLYCLGAGRQRRPLTNAPRDRSLDCFGVVLLADGVGRFADPARSERVEGPALWWLFPSVPHSYRTDGERWRDCWLLFDGPAARAYRTAGVLDPSRPLAPDAATAAAAPLMRHLVEQCLAADGAPPVTTSALLHRLIVTATGSRDGVAAPGAELLAQLRADAHLPLSVAQRARRLGLSEPELRALASTAGGAGPHELVLTARIERAQGLLATTDSTVGAIARAVGYPDQGYFTRLFTRRVGMPPGEFRRRQQR